MKKPERQSLIRLLDAAGEAMQAGLPPEAALAIAIADEGSQVPPALREALADVTREGERPAERLAGTVGANCEAWLRQIDALPSQGVGLTLIAEALPHARKLPAGAVLIVVDLIALLAVSLLVAFFIAPTWIEMFGNIGATLPLPTRAAVAAAYAMVPVMLLLLGAAVLSQFWLRRAQSLGGLADRIDRLLLALPVVRHWLRIRESSRVARWLSLGRGSALAAFDALSEAGAGTLPGRLAARVAADLREGVALADALDRAGAFLPGLASVLRNAEQLEGQPFARFLERYAIVTARREGASLEKLIFTAHAATGVLVGLYVIAMYLPIFKMGSVV